MTVRERSVFRTLDDSLFRPVGSPTQENSGWHDASVALDTGRYTALNVHTGKPDLAPNTEENVKVQGTYKQDSIGERYMEYSQMKT